MVDVLAIGAHPDDIELGAGATIRNMVDAGMEVHGLALVNAYTSKNKSNLAHPLMQKAAGILGYTPHLMDYTDQQLDTYPLVEIVNDIAAIVKELQPTTIMVHSPSDLNEDHRIVAQATITACRPTMSSSVHDLRHYYVPSATGWGFALRPEFKPQIFSQVSKEALELKWRALQCYDETPPWPHPRSKEAIEATAAHFGAISGQGHAEPFELSYRREGW